MLEFIIISGIATIIINKGSNYVINKAASDRGWVDYRKPGRISLGKALFFCTSLIPGVNFISALYHVGIAGFMVFGNSKDVDKLMKRVRMHTPTDELDTVQYLKNMADEKTLSDAMTLDGASKEVINSELKKAKEEVYSDYSDLNDKEYRKLQAMSDTELWLSAICLDAGLSLDEKKKLFSSYVKDFKNDKENAKPKAIQKTYQVVANRK